MKTIFAGRLLLLLIAFDQASGQMILSRQCPNIYEDGYLFDNTEVTYATSKSHCDEHDGKLPFPTDKGTWDESLRLMRDKDTTGGRRQIGYWVGVTFKRDEDSKVTAHDVKGNQLPEIQRKLIGLNDSEVKERLEAGETQCLVYARNDSWRFDLQACKSADRAPRARTVCQCLTELKREEKAEPVDPFAKASTAKTVEAKDDNESESVSLKSKIKGRAGPGDENGGDITTKENSSSTSTPLIVIMGLLVACGMVATAYYVSKKRGWNVREMISRRMPYNNGPRVSVNGSIYSRGQELIDVTSNHRPIHVYEEIIPRNSGIIPPAVHRDPLLSCSSSITIPRDPPPEPPNDPSPHRSTAKGECSRKLSEDGYLRPSFHRGDAIPGDVRSPPPIISNVFDFPSTSRSKKPQSLRLPPEKELKYASVETVQTLLDGETVNDEEYLLSDDEGKTNFSATASLVVELPEVTNKENSRKESLSNSYVPIKGASSLELLGNDSDVASSPVFPHPGAYENERFLNTGMKAPRPSKPKRKAHIAPVKLETQPVSGEESVVYSRISSDSNEPVYSQIKRKEVKSIEIPDESGPYTPMRGGNGALIKRVGESPSKNEESTPIKRDLAAVESNDSNTVGNIHISTPTMQSTTNEALENSSLACYEIPPESEDFV